jgi:uncharacterized membrane protein (DUF106 family)
MLFDRAESNQELLDFFMQIQNNGFIDDSTVSRIHKEAKKFFEAPIQNEKGVKILQQLKDTKKKMLTDLISKSDIIDRFSKWF